MYWEHPDENDGLLAIGQVLEETASGPERFHRLDQIFNYWKNRIEIQTERSSTELPVFLTAAAFSPVISSPEWRPFPVAALMIPEIMVVRREGESTGCVNLLIDSENQSRDQYLMQLKAAESRLRTMISGTQPLTGRSAVGEVSLNGSRDEWIDTVRQGIRAIDRHQLEKVVLATRSDIEFPTPPSVPEILSDMRNNYPSCLLFAQHNLSGGTFFGASPEWLARIRDDVITCDALAGSAARDPDSGKDSALGYALLESKKNRSEHQFVVEYLERSLKSLVREFTHSDRPVLQKLQNVQHLHTPVTGELKADVTPFQVLHRVHPTPSVGGIPSDRAMELIAELEGFDRGYFAGILGWLNTSGDGDFAVGLRSGLIHENRIRIYAGAGIVSDSDPEEEYREIQLKLQPIVKTVTAPDK